MEDKQLTTQESLALISRMIDNGRRNFSNGFGRMLLVAGYATVVITALIIVLLHVTGNHHFMWLWAALPVIIWIFAWKQDRKNIVKTHIDNIVSGVWGVFTIAVVAMMIYIFTVDIISSTSPRFVVPSLIIAVMMSLCTAITGKIIRFRPAVLCGFLGFGFSFGLTMLHGMWKLPWFGFIAIIVFVIPGHILRRQER